MADVSYRPLTIDDYDSMLALWKDNGVSVTQRDSRTNTGLFLKKNAPYCFAASAGNKMIGFIMVGCDSRSARVYHLVVASEWCRAGITHELIRKAWDILRGEGICGVDVIVFREDPAVEFWESEGFRDTDGESYRFDDGFRSEHVRQSGHRVHYEKIFGGVSGMGFLGEEGRCLGSPHVGIGVSAGDGYEGRTRAGGGHEIDDAVANIQYILRIDSAHGVAEMFQGDGSGFGIGLLVVIVPSDYGVEAVGEGVHPEDLFCITPAPSGKDTGPVSHPVEPPQKVLRPGEGSRGGGVLHLEEGAFVPDDLLGLLLLGLHPVLVEPSVSVVEGDLVMHPL